MNYSRIYEKLIFTRKQLNRNKKQGMYEVHHILPSSLGGSNDHSNLVVLTPREHFLAHLLLYRMHTGKDKAKMAYALFRMCSNNPTQKRNVTARQYEIARKAVIDTCRGELHHSYNKSLWSDEEKLEISKRQSGSSNSMYGKTPWNKGKKGAVHSDETKEKMSKAHKGKQFSDNTRKKLSDAHKGKTLSEETKEKLRQINLGKKLKPESIEKTASANRGKKQEVLTCPHCLKTGGNTMYRWHFDRCREKK